MFNPYPFILNPYDFYAMIYLTCLLIYYFHLTDKCIKCIVCIIKIHTDFREVIKLMKILISNVSEKPLYQQIKEQIKDQIFKNELSEGEVLPSIRNFANDIKVSVLTIRRVYDELEQEGFVTSQVGIGTFVSAGNIELLRDSKRRLVEEKMQDLIQTSRMLGITKSELNAMMDILYEEDVNNE